MIVEIAGKVRIVEIQPVGGRLRCTVSALASPTDERTNDARAVEAEAIEIAPGIYSVLVDGGCFETRAEANAAGATIHVVGKEYQATVRDPRQWSRKRGAHAESEGSQQVVAPMSGKIVRVLVKAGDAIETGQGIVVVEAMKMQNEVRSPKTGRIERILVLEGQTVNSGDILAVVG